MQTTYKKLIEFVNLANSFLKVAEDAKEKETPLSAALSDSLEDWKDDVEQYNKKLSRLRRKYAEKDKKTTVLLKDAYGNYQFTEQGENDLEDAVEVLLNEEVTIQTACVSDVPEDLHRGYLKAFRGFVIDQEYQPTKKTAE